jgi:hypothetical protein
VLWNVRTEKAAIGDRPTVVDDNQFHDAGGAVLSGISRSSATLFYGSHGPLRYWDTEPGKEVWVFSHLNNEPLLCGAVTGTAKSGPVISGENVLHAELYLETAKNQHRVSPLSTANSPAATPLNAQQTCLSAGRRGRYRLRKYSSSIAPLEGFVLFENSSI